MKKLTLVACTALLACFYLWSCEKDDICSGDTVVTPSLIITFYNADNRDIPRSGNIDYWMEDESKVKLRSNSVDSIAIPLRTDAETARWGFALRTIAPLGGENYNTDYIDFNYLRNEIYVSRACGYKSVFYLNQDSQIPAAVLSDTIPADNLWIKDIEIVQDSVIDENSTHVKIYY